MLLRMIHKLPHTFVINTPQQSIPYTTKFSSIVDQVGYPRLIGEDSVTLRTLPHLLSCPFTHRAFLSQGPLKCQGVLPTMYGCCFMALLMVIRNTVSHNETLDGCS